MIWSMSIEVLTGGMPMPKNLQNKTDKRGGVSDPNRHVEFPELFSLFNEIGIIAQLSSNEFEKCLPDRLTTSQFAVLNWFLRVDSEATPGRLARAFQLTGGAITNTLKKLEAKGLVKIEPDALSGRKKRVTLTRAGRVMRDKAVKATTPLLDEFAGRVRTGKTGKLLKELQEIRQYLDERRL